MITVGVCSVNINHNFFSSFVEFWGNNKSRYDLQLHLKHRMLLHEAQNDIARTALGEKASHVLFIEDDIVDIPEDALGKMLDLNKDVIGAYYRSRHYPFNPTCQRLKEGEKDICGAIGKSIRGNSGLIPVNGEGVLKTSLIGFGFTLIKTDVFRAIGVEERWFFYGLAGATDAYFFDLCRKNNVDVHVCFDVRVKHCGIDDETAIAHLKRERFKRCLTS